MEVSSLKLNSHKKYKIIKKDRNDDINSFIKKGHTQRYVAEIFNISPRRVREILKVHYPETYKDIYKPHFCKSNIKADRNLKIYHLYCKGLKIKEIAKKFDICTTRIIQVVKYVMYKKDFNQDDFNMIRTARKN